MLQHNSLQPPLFEALEYKDMEGVLKPTIHVDEFASKMGDDDDIAVLSFFVRDKQAARDLADWFEKGYDWVLDADISPGEISPGRFLVYIETQRRSTLPQRVEQALDDLSTLTEYQVADWLMTYEDQEVPFSEQAFRDRVPLSPAEYRKRKEQDLNEMRTAAGIDTKPIFTPDRELQKLQSAAGI